MIALGLRSLGLASLGDADITFGEYLAVHGKSYGAGEIDVRRVV